MGVYNNLELFLLVKILVLLYYLVKIIKIEWLSQIWESKKISGGNE